MTEVDENPHLQACASDVNPKDLRPPPVLRSSPSSAFLSLTVARKDKLWQNIVPRCRSKKKQGQGVEACSS
ncbi:unnamed protein product [Lactuca virosa]|uniref:Uncharacterized protein n=1 Tax=Lactuca virosa TaxID=75947 RepID=A0AAU9LV74_9ASTR|nr:unnamed protein product [Lactuca virosa]